jgi:hypothetical protein
VFFEFYFRELFIYTKRLNLWLLKKSGGHHGKTGCMKKSRIIGHTALVMREGNPRNFYYVIFFKLNKASLSNNHAERSGCFYAYSIAGKKRPKERAVRISKTLYPVHSKHS